MARVISVYLPLWPTDRLRRQAGDTAPSPEIPGLKYIRLEPAHPHDILNTLEALPDLEAVFFAGTFTYRTGRLGEIDYSGEKEVREYLDTSNFVVIPPQEGDSDGIEPAFSRYIRSRA